MTELADGVRELRIGLGLSRRELAAALSISESKLARWEQGLRPHPDLWDACRLMRLLGNDLVVKWYPAGGVLRDGAHARLLSSFLALLPASLPRWLEVPIPVARDLRAWDVVVHVAGARIGVAVETRLRDLQALLRQEEAKARDSDVDRILLVLLDSHANRRAVREGGEALRSALPLDGRAILPALRDGRDPGANGLLFLRVS
ncbi:MAG: helix-turn-helix domain-containing protein [Candidatus Limnocylindria bacterium]